jgi:hypothetical protein
MTGFVGAQHEFRDAAFCPQVGYWTSAIAFGQIEVVAHRQRVKHLCEPQFEHKAAAHSMRFTPSD